MLARNLAVVLVAAMIGGAEAAPVSRYALYDSRTNEWCSDYTRVRFEAAVQKRQALQVVSLTSENGNPTKLDVTEEGESGDWLVYDTYRFDKTGSLVSANRIINDVSSQEQVVESYAIQNGRARKTSSRLNDLSGKPKPGKPEWTPEIAILTDYVRTPYYQLLHGPAQERCIKAK